MKKVDPGIFLRVLPECQDVHSIVHMRVRLHLRDVCGFMSSCQK